MNIALLIAGGSGNRMGQDIPKQFMHVDGCPIIIHTMRCFQSHPDIDAIAVVCLKGWETVLQAYANQFCIDKLKWIFPGGKSDINSSLKFEITAKRLYAAQPKSSLTV